MSPTTAGRARGRVTAENRLVVPPEVVRAAELRPGDEVLFEAALGGFFVQSRASAEAEDDDGREALTAPRTDPEDTGEPSDWAEVKRELNL